MSDTNRVFIMGRLTRDAQLKTNQNGLETAHFSIANNRSKRNLDGTWGQVVNFIDLTLYGDRAKATAPYLIQGQQVFIEAHLAQKHWEKDGKKFQRLEVEIDDLKFSGRYQKFDSDKEASSTEIETATGKNLPLFFEQEDC